MFFKRKKTLKEEMEEARETMQRFVRDICYEIEAQRQMAQKMELFTNDEFAQFMEDFLNEASVFYDDMDVDEILAERMGNKIKNMLGADEMEVLKVEL